MFSYRHVFFFTTNEKTKQQSNAMCNKHICLFFGNLRVDFSRMGGKRNKYIYVLFVRLIIVCRVFDSTSTVREQIYKCIIHEITIESFMVQILSQNISRNFKRNITKQKNEKKETHDQYLSFL